MPVFVKNVSILSRRCLSTKACANNAGAGPGEKKREKVPLTRFWFASVDAIYTGRFNVFARGSLGIKSKAFILRGYRLYGSVEPLSTQNIVVLKLSAKPSFCNI